MSKYEKRSEIDNKSILPNKKLVAFLFLISIVLVLVKIFLASQLAVEGERIQKINEQKEALQEDNQKLRNQIADVSSLGLIEDKATKKGFIKLSKIDFVILSRPVALGP